MKKFVLGGVAAAAFCAVGPALAQTPAPAPVPAPQIQDRLGDQGFRGMRDRTFTRNETLEHTRMLFSRLDANRDGFIDRQEAGTARQKMAGAMRDRAANRVARNGTSVAQRGAAFDRMDTNRDGVITRDEFATAHSGARAFAMREHGPGGKRMHAMGMGLHGKMFDRADTNHDGRVSLQEMTNSALQHFDMADANHDGQLTPQEREQMHQRMREQRRPA